MLANPQSSFLSIHFPLTLLFGEVIGTKLAIPLYLFIGLFGMWLVCRKLQIGILASYIPPILVMLSGVYAIRVTVGHTNWFHLAWIPWIFLFFLKAKEQKKWILPAAFLLALIFLGGGIHPFIIAIVLLGTYTLFATIKEWKQEKTKTVVCLLLLLVLWMPFAAIKLVPMLAVSDEMLPLETTDVQPNSISLLIEALTQKEIKFDETPQYSFTAEGESIPWSWHEYYGYVGVLPLFLFVIATFVVWKKSWEYSLSAFFIFFLILSQNLFPSAWGMIQSLHFASIFHGPSRFLFAAIFFMAITIGFFLASFEKKQNKVIFSAIFLLFCIILFGLTLQNSFSVFENGLYVEPQKNLSQMDFYSVFAENKENYDEQYPSFLRNQGILNCYERFHVALAALPKMSSTGIEYGDYHGEAYLYQINEPQNITFFSPNKIIVSVENKEGILMLNQNYVSGWKVKIDGNKAEILNTDGLVSTEIAKENKEVEFYYLPNAFLVGLLITIGALAGSLFLYFGQKI